MNTDLSQRRRERERRRPEVKKSTFGGTAYACTSTTRRPHVVQAPVVQRVDSTIHWITQLILIALIR